MHNIYIFRRQTTASKRNSLEDKLYLTKEPQCDEYPNDKNNVQLTKIDVKFGWEKCQQGGQQGRVITS